jgi:hypothetical protein
MRLERAQQQRRGARTHNGGVAPLAASNGNTKCMCGSGRSRRSRRVTHINRIMVNAPILKEKKKKIFEIFFFFFQTCHRVSLIIECMGEDKCFLTKTN